MKAVFFDADGTIADIKKGVPDNTRKAIRDLMANGHLAFLCTGRSWSFVPEEIRSSGFTGIVAGAGTYLSYGGKVLHDKELDCELAWTAACILRKYGLIPVMEGTNYMYFDEDEYTDEVDWFCSLTKKILGERYRSITGYEHSMHINKISAKVMPGSDPEKALEELAPYLEPIRHDSGMGSKTIELLPLGYSKASGIAMMCEELSVPMEDTVCFGDSNNDLSMFRTAALKIAMGNSSERILKLADYVTANWDDDGIGKALRKFGLIR